MKREVGDGVDVRRTVGDVIKVIVDHRTKCIDVRPQGLKTGDGAIIRATKARGKWGKRSNWMYRRVLQK